MSDKKEKTEEKSKAEKPKKKSRARAGFRAQVMFIFLVIAAAVFMPTSVMLCIGMMPTLVANLIDRSRRKSKVLTVGAMNLAGCTPFLLQLWYSEHTLERSLELVLNPLTIVVMYVAAAIGYLVDWAVTGFVAGLLYQKGLARQKDIINLQEALVRRWGPEVTGEIPLDNQGFAVK